MFARIAVPLRLPALTYAVPPDMRLSPGDAVQVKVRNRSLGGVVLKITGKSEADPAFKIRDVEGISEDFPRFSPEMLRLMEWASEYYHYPVGEVLRGLLPPVPAPFRQEMFRLSPAGKSAASADFRGSRQKAVFGKVLQSGACTLESGDRPAARKLLELGILERFLEMEKPPPFSAPSKDPDISLTDHQSIALGEIRSSLEERAFRTFLLQGVTGSGKTEVYLRAAAHCLSSGRNVLLVVPEISLTPQLVSRFRSRLGEGIALLHSGISDRERSRHWHFLNEGFLRICIGARSASFSPIGNIGLVIVDEEHDSALKQEDHLRYNARDLAIMRGKIHSATVILGSATPSLESYQNALSGRYRHLELPERPSGRSLPKVMVVDRSKDSSEGSLSNALKVSMQQTLGSGGQVMLLLNRRGFSSFLICSSCGYVPECPNCSVSLTNYRSSSRLKCHYCGYSAPLPGGCGRCGNEKIQAGTLGTESLEEEVKEAFPGRTVIRIDRESTERKGSLERALHSIASGEAEIVIGTQMIAKGHDFPNIALVGVVNADSSFHLPDFRASERSFQLFTQMAGRAGRGDCPGKVILQTLNPLHPSIVHSTNHDFRRFAEEEMGLRLSFGYPPFTRMARLLFSAGSPSLAEGAAEKAAACLRRHSARLGVEIVGPSPAALMKVQNRYRWHMILKSRKAPPLHQMLASLQSWATTLDRKVVVQVDVDPVSLM